MSSFRKHRPDAPAGFFEAEAAGLRWLAAAAADGGALVVEVLDIGPGFLELQRLRAARPTAEAAEAFGRALAITHAAGAPAFGSPPDGWTGDGWIGRQRQAMRSTTSWGEFYAEQRVRPFVRLARDGGNLAADGAALVDRLCDRIAAGEFDDDRPPARLHGDLWAGNLVYTADGVVLIDPAAHGGHGQTDLAMLELFGCPGLDRIRAGYAEAAALPADWPERTPLHQLHPVAVHAVSHGPGYGRELIRLAKGYC
ncbi:fructosamine kinase family protein [Nakamurella lactea]|uniref:fructosamine kinase family protein n=1 Tax=Nakamurella lactea TaxID=459515 RepID=UPI00040A7C37|nr:fructosamine kinase family protein [Nakamurella lactea]